ncbi:MAG: DedA family protein [Terriglobales bacterium]
MHSWLGQLQQLFTAYGGWALAALLLLENAGVPLPGEATLFYAAYLSREGRFLAWPLVFLIAAAACTVGDNLGYWIGREAGDGVRRLLRLTPGKVGYAQRFFRRYGAATIFFARFITGLRVIAGPVAGISRMRWETFLSWNAAGAVAWAAAVTAAGYLLGRHLRQVLHTAGRIEWVLIAVAAAAILYGVHKIDKVAERALPPDGANHSR